MNAGKNKIQFKIIAVLISLALGFEGIGYSAPGPALKSCLRKPMMALAELGRANSAKTQINRRLDLERRYAIDRIVEQIKDYILFDAKVEDVMGKLERGEQLLKGDKETIIEIRRRLLMKNPLAALRKAEKGDFIVVFNMPLIKFLNTAIQMHGTDTFIEEAQDMIVKLMVKYGLIESAEINALPFTYKQTKFILKLGLDEDKAYQTLTTLTQELSRQLTDYLKGKYTDNQAIQGVTVEPYFGMSVVQKSEDDARILADFQALQAAKIARRERKTGSMFIQAEFDKLMLEAKNIAAALNLKIGECPLIEEMLEVRGRSEEDLRDRQLLIKKYLDIIDLFDYPKVWSADVEQRTIEQDTFIDILKEMGKIQEGQPSDGSRAIRKAMAIIKTNSKHHAITSGEAFYYHASKLIKEHKGEARVVAADVVGFWASIQANLAHAHSEYIDSSPEQKEQTMIRAALKADDKVKALLTDKINKIVSRLRSAVPMVDIEGEKRYLINQEGGDEIVVFIPGNEGWQGLAQDLSDKDLGVRIIAAQVNPVHRNLSMDDVLGLYMTQVAHAGFGEAYISSQQGDAIAKKHEKEGRFGMVVSLEERNGEYSWWSYDGQKVAQEQASVYPAVYPLRGGRMNRGQALSANLEMVYIGEVSERFPNGLVKNIFRSSEEAAKVFCNLIALSLDGNHVAKPVALQENVIIMEHVPGISLQEVIDNKEEFPHGFNLQEELEGLLSNIQQAKNRYKETEQGHKAMLYIMVERINELGGNVTNDELIKLQEELKELPFEKGSILYPKDISYKRVIITPGGLRIGNLGFEVRLGVEDGLTANWNRYYGSNVREMRILLERTRGINPGHVGAVVSHSSRDDL